MSGKNKTIKKNTIDSMDLSYFFTSLENKPVYAYCAYNYYRLYKVVDLGECYVLLSPEEEGCWMPSDSIRQSEQTKPEIKQFIEDDNGPDVA